jgi:membrane-bound ClpP family serine protease
MLLTIAILTFFGVLLMMLETFVPGWIAGIIGLICILTAIVLTVSSEELQSWPSWGRTSLATGIVVFSTASLLVWMKYFAIKFWHRAFTLKAQIDAPSASNLPLLEAEGTAITDLRPLGRAEISGKRYDVRCEDGFASANARLRVTGREPGNLIVRLVS